MYTKKRTTNNSKKTRKHHKHDSHHKHDENKYKKIQCSPDNNENNYTCYNNDNLEKMKQLWNARHPSKLITSNDTREIWDQLKENIGSSCNKESCWLKQKFMEGNVSQDLLNYTFSPKSPESWKNNRNEWLSSTDIERVMKQYEKSYNCFDFIGPSPIDYDTHKLYGECVWEELCKFNLTNQIKKGKTKIGIVFNTDPHTKEGEHWICLFINIKKKYIIYFDSVGNYTPKQINKFIKNVKNQGNNMDMKFKVFKNTLKHQRKDSECGMYCLHVIIELLKDKINPTELLSKRITDEEMQSYRKKYFNSEI
jgi:hypothetical protein